MNWRDSQKALGALKAQGAHRAYGAGETSTCCVYILDFPIL